MPLEKPTIPVSFPGSIRKSDLLKRCILRSGRRCCLPFLLLEEALPLHDKSGCDSNGGSESQYDEGYRPGVHPELEGEAVGAEVAELIGNDHLVASVVLELPSGRSQNKACHGCPQHVSKSQFTLLIGILFCTLG